MFLKNVAVMMFTKHVLKMSRGRPTQYGLLRDLTRLTTTHSNVSTRLVQADAGRALHRAPLVHAVNTTCEDVQTRG